MADRIDADIRGRLTRGGRLAIGKITTARLTIVKPPPPAVTSITVFPDPVPSGGTATIYINATDPNSSGMTFTLACDTGPAPQPTSNVNVWTWTAP